MDYEEVINRYLRLGPSISLGQWNKHGLSNPSTDSKKSQMKEQCYIKSTGSNHGIHTLHISLHINGSAIFRVKTPNKTSFDQLIIALIESSFPIVCDNKNPFEYSLTLSSLNPRTALLDALNLAQFLSMLVKLDSSTVALIDDICHVLNLEEAFPYVLNSKNQNLIDSKFDKLCGYQRMSICVRDIKGDLNTLLKLAEQIRKLNQQLQITRAPIADDDAAIVSVSRIKGTLYYHNERDSASLDTVKLEHSSQESAGIL